MQTRFVVVAAFLVTALALSGPAHARGSTSAISSEQGSDSSEKKADGKEAPKERIVAPKAPHRMDKCGLVGDRATNPFVQTTSLLKGSWNSDEKIAYALLTSGDYVWVNLKQCEKYKVTAKLFVMHGPKSSDTKYWLERAAEVADTLQGPILDDEVAALDKIASSGKWFVRKTASGISMEFPMAMEQVQFTATVTDFDDFTVLTLTQDAS